MDAYDQKQRLKDEKLLQLELAVSKHDKQFKDTVEAISDATQQEFDKMAALSYEQRERLEAHESNLSLITETLT